MNAGEFAAAKRTIALGEARVSYFDSGEGPPVLFLHGCPFASFIWRNVITPLMTSFRCIAPDLLGLGDTETPPSADWSLRAQTAAVLALLDALALPSVHVVGHDHGGAIAQILAAEYPERVKRLVLANVEAYDNWPSAEERPFVRIAQLPLIGDVVLWIWSWRPVLRATLIEARAVHNRQVLTPEFLDAYVRANFANRHRRRKTRRFLAGQFDRRNNQVTLEIVDGLRRFDHPRCSSGVKTIRTSACSGASGCSVTYPEPCDSIGYPLPVTFSWKNGRSNSQSSSLTFWRMKGDAMLTYEIPKALLRVGAIASIAAGILITAGFILHPAGEDATFGTDPFWVPAHAVLWAAFVLALVGWIATYIVQASSAGRLGVVAFVLVVVGTSLASWIFSSDVTFVPVIAAESPGLFKKIFSGSHIAVGIISVLSWVAGVVLFGITVIRSRVFPRTAGVLLVIGPVIIPIAYLSGLSVRVVAVGGAITAAGQIWIGYELLRHHT